MPVDVARRLASISDRGPPRILVLVIEHGAGDRDDSAPEPIGREPDGAAGRRDAQPLSGWLAIALVTGTSAAVLVLEILAGRLLAPYVGVSLETFTGIIGVILAGIALGAWAGGVLADRVDPRRLLAPLLILGGALAIATIPVVRLLGEASGSGGGPRILFLTTFGFLPSATVLSAVPPAVVKLQLRELATTGATVGSLSAWGTAGAIFGTFFTGYVLVASAAVTTLIISVGLVLVLAGIALQLAFGLRQRRELLASVVVVAVTTATAAGVGTPCETQTAYYCVSIVSDAELASGRTLVLDDLRHSYVDLDDPTHLEFWYVRRLVDAIDLWASSSDAAAQTTTPAEERAIDAVYLGGGALTLPRHVRATRPGSEQVVFEIDGDLVDLVVDRLGFVSGADIDVVIGDGRLLLRDLPNDSADVVIGDAFGGRAVPFHLTTRDFVDDIDAVLRDDGIYAVNVIDGGGEQFLRAHAATVSDVFAHVVVVRGPLAVRGRRGNSVIVASQRPLDAEALADRLRAEIADDQDETDQDETVNGDVLAADRLDDYLEGVRILTDDFAPVDQLLLRAG